MRSLRRSTVLLFSLAGVAACSEDGPGVGDFVPDLDAGTGGTGASATGGAAGMGGASGVGGQGGGDAGAPGQAGGGGAAGAPTVPDGAGVGDSCSDDQPCRPGLRCADAVCEPSRSSPLGAPCTISAECEPGLQCVGATCASAGEGVEGDPCLTDASCQAGLRCDVVGLALQCIPEGDGDIGAECATGKDCYAGLSCVAGSCVFAPLGPLAGLSWPGVDCEATSETEVRAYFEVPGADPPGEAGDFFRLPFPNDVRRSETGLDLTGFPTPGAGVLGFDAVARYVEAVSGETGWGTTPTVFFRFSGPIDAESIEVGFTDITPGSPEYGYRPGHSWVYSPERTKYVCSDWLAVRRLVSRMNDDGTTWGPLRPGHTYAVWLTTSMRSATGEPIARSEHLTALLSDTPPSDPALLAAHTAYAPFRAFLADPDKPADNPGSPEEILNATLITAAEVRAPMAALAEAVETEPVPVANSWVLCGDGVSSPCPQAEGGRACGTGDEAYDEYQALIELPVFQRGTAPYLAPDDGGDIASEPVRTEAVCLSLSVPKATMPDSGWPLVIHAHGTGGSYRGHVRPEVAGAFSDAVAPTEEVPMAVLGIDQVQHGPRRGDSTSDPEDLFFNFANPKAARGNPLQGAADQLALVRWASTLDVPAEVSGGARILIDPDAIVFFGHSQGATHGSLAMPYTDGVQAVVLSGNGASLMHALLAKTQPVNLPAVLPLLLGDATFSPESEAAIYHPVLSLLQHWIDPADPLNFATSIAFDPPEGRTGKHVFQTFGLGDSYSPPQTMELYALMASLDLVASTPPLEVPYPIGNLMEVPAPLAGNRSGLTLGVRRYPQTPGEDGHFVAFATTPMRDIRWFLAMAAIGEVPQIGQ